MGAFSIHNSHQPLAHPKEITTIQTKRRAAREPRSPKVEFANDKASQDAIICFLRTVSPPVRLSAQFNNEDTLSRRLMGLSSSKSRQFRQLWRSNSTPSRPLRLMRSKDRRKGALTSGNGYEKSKPSFFTLKDPVPPYNISSALRVKLTADNGEIRQYPTFRRDNKIESDAEQLTEHDDNLELPDLVTPDTLFGVNGENRSADTRRDELESREGQIVSSRKAPRTGQMHEENTCEVKEHYARSVSSSKAYSIPIRTESSESTLQPHHIRINKALRVSGPIAIPPKDQTRKSHDVLSNSPPIHSKRMASVSAPMKTHDDFSGSGGELRRKQLSRVAKDQSLRRKPRPSLPENDKTQEQIAQGARIFEESPVRYHANVAPCKYKNLQPNSMGIAARVSVEQWTKDYQCSSPGDHVFPWRKETHSFKRQPIRRNRDFKRRGEAEEEESRGDESGTLFERHDLLPTYCIPQEDGVVELPPISLSVSEESLPVKNHTRSKACIPSLLHSKALDKPKPEKNEVSRIITLADCKPMAQLEMQPCQCLSGRNPRKMTYHSHGTQCQASEDIEPPCSSEYVLVARSDLRELKNLIQTYLTELEDRTRLLEETVAFPSLYTSQPKISAATRTSGAPEFHTSQFPGGAPRLDTPANSSHTGLEPAIELALRNFK